MSPVDVSSRIDSLLQAYEAAAASTRVHDFEPFLPPPNDPARAEAIRELTRVALELRWTRGERPDPSEYLSRFPELNDSDAIAEIAYEDYRQRILAGDRPSRDSYRSRYGVDVTDWPGPEAATAKFGSTEYETPFAVADTPTEEIVSPARVLEQRLDAFTRPFPEAGATFAGFRLTRELGRGAFGRVYLAEQVSLANRRVALKVSPRLAGEVRTLARLQHTNIVPVYSAHQSPPFTALCMPFFGATTLASVISDLITEGKPTSGRSIVEAIRRRRMTNGDSKSPPATIALLETASHVDAVLWIGERLADALAHAHERGIVHRDIKPANVLIADDGRPMLLDFNLAADDNDEAAERARIGGTLPYMAPEQVEAFGGETKTVDGRADVYSLGAVLFQLLTGRLPYPEHTGETELVLRRMQADRTGPVPLLREHNPQITSAVESIVRKCLEQDRAKRYQSAEALRDDIARQRANLPLQYAAEPSLRERASKWVRRHPKLVSPAALTAYSAAILLAVSALVVRLSLDARAKRHDSERGAALRHFEEFQPLGERVRVASEPKDVLAAGTEALAFYGATEADWDQRDDVTRLPEIERSRLKSEVGEVAFLTARAASQVRHDSELADRLNALAEKTLEADAKQAAAIQKTNLTGVSAEQISVALDEGGRSSFLHACDLSARGRHRDALVIAVKYVARHPNDFGGWFLKARCHRELGQYDEARACYSTCSALRPNSPHPLIARGILEHKYLRDPNQALADYTRALQLDENNFDARLNRALVLRAIGKYPDALVELDRLLANPNCQTRVYFVRAQVRRAMGDKEGAEVDRDQGMKREPRDPASLVTRGLDRAQKEPLKALDDFIAAEQLDPLYPDALINQAWILGEKLNRTEEAIAATDRLLAFSPDNMNGRAGRAVMLARIGRNEEALAEAKRCMELASSPATIYRAGCVYAIASAKDPKYREEGVRLIATALLRGFGHEHLLSDSDLDSLRNDERFRKLMEGVKLMQELGK